MDNRKRHLWAALVAIFLSLSAMAQRDTCYCRLVLLPEAPSARSNGALFMSPVVRRVRDYVDLRTGYMVSFYYPVWVEDEVLGFKVNWDLIPINRIYDQEFCDKSRLEKGPYY